MDQQPISKLRSRLEVLKRERDELNCQVLQERSHVQEIESRLLSMKNQFESVRRSLIEKEQSLQKFNETIKKSEDHFAKLLQNSSSLLTAIEQEAANSNKP